MNLIKERIIENPVIRDQVNFKATVAETNGRHSLLQLEVAPRGGNALHYHKTFSETFLVTEGVLGVVNGRRKLTLEKGESTTVKAGTPHRFYNPSRLRRAKFAVLLSPGHRGMEIALQVAYGLAKDGHCSKKGLPKNIYHIALLTEWSETFAPGVLTLFSPLLRYYARRAKQKGIDKMLLKKYCRY